MLTFGRGFRRSNLAISTRAAIFAKAAAERLARLAGRVDVLVKTESAVEARAVAFACV